MSHHLAAGLAIRACQAGHRVALAAAAARVDALATAHQDGRLQEELRRLGRHGCWSSMRSAHPLEPEAANLYLQLVSTRYERASLIVTSNELSGRGAKSSATTSSLR